MKAYLRKKGAVRLALVTPYGATKSDFFAISADRKLEGTRAVPGRVGHDRVQQGGADASIGEEIRRWYKLSAGDFERIDVDIEERDGVFYLTPLNCYYAQAGGGRKQAIDRVLHPLSCSGDHVSRLWKRQLEAVRRHQPEIFIWSLREVGRVVRDHLPETKLAHVQETDILRASGPLRHLGIALGGYVGKGYDCLTEFSFLNYPAYGVPVEIKRSSAGFAYQQRKYGKDELSRAVVLCAVHDHRQLPAHIDVIELRAFAQFEPRP